MKQYEFLNYVFTGQHIFNWYNKFRHWMEEKHGPHILDNQNENER